MVAVVTGAAGFIGRTLVRRLVARGEHVVAVDRHPHPAAPGVTVLTTELTAADPAVVAALAAADRVFHLAGCPGVRDRAADIAARRQRDNVEATAAVLAVTPPTTPLLVTSSSSVYGGARDGRPSREDMPLRPRGGYARSKVAAERLCRRRLREGGLVAVARPFTVAGEGQRPDMAIARWIADARAGRPLRILGSLERTRDVADVRQVADALIDLADHKACGPVNVGGGARHTLRELVEAVGYALGVETRTVVEPADPVEVTDTLADTTWLRELIGWAPRTDLLDVVRRQVAASQPDPDVVARQPVAELAVPA